MTDKDWPRFMVTCMVFVLFAFILWHNVQDEMLIGAMIGALTTAVAFWLGSSKGSADKSTELSRQASETQTVQIEQPAGKRVPVTEGEP